MSQEQPESTSRRGSLPMLSQPRHQTFSRFFLLFILAATAVVFFLMVKIFLVPVMLAAVFAGLFYPFYKWLVKILYNKKGLGSFVCCLVLLLGLLIPAYVVADLVSREAIEFYQLAEKKIREVVAAGDAGLLGEIKRAPLVQHLRLDEFDWQSSLEEVAKTAASLLAAVINKASKGTFQLLTNLFLTFFAMFYFFRDGDRLIQRIKYLSPLADEYEEELIKRFISVSRATIKGTLLIGLLKGGLGALTFWLFGVGSPILWGVVMAILSIIPMVGAWLVMYPAAIIMIITGNIVEGIAVFLIAALIIGNIDNVLTPRLVGREAGMHDLLIFFSTIGGISLFGVMGFILGPVIAALFITILDIYGVEFKSQLDFAQNQVMAKVTESLTQTSKERLPEPAQ